MWLKMDSEKDRSGDRGADHWEQASRLESSSGQQWDNEDDSSILIIPLEDNPHYLREDNGDSCKYK